ncbi:MAG TPA: hypothetical protein VFP22_07910, partial [Candidatus Limnocylindrales bacterium]|nr:hypothetical protein [Candidatus Limnocylindrales bacterium]
MPRKYRRPTLVLGLVAVVAALVAIFAGVSHGPSHVAIDKSKLMVDPDRAGALASSHARTTVGLKSAKNHEGIRTPASLQLQELQDRAYPANTVLNAWQNAARSDFASDKARGADGSGSWQLAGPATSTVPSLLNRTNSDETVSGRVTAMAIDSTCTASLCRVWVGAAGGGIWRSDNGLAADPHWTYVSGNLPTNAVGTLTYDAASHTLYAGTGEPNSSADSDAGLGIFASTDYGDHWTLLPGSPAMSAGNSIGSIVLDPAHPGTMWVGTTYGVRGMAGVGGGAQPSYIAPDAPKPGLWKSTDGGQSFSTPVVVSKFYELPDCLTYQSSDAGRACVPEKGPTHNSV